MELAIALAFFVLVLLVVFATTLVRVTFGFGNALLAMPLLTLLAGIQIATPLVGLVSTAIAATMLAASWRNVDVSAAWRLSLTSLLGVPFGLLLLRGVPEALVRGLLGLLLIGFGFYNLLRLQLPRLQDNRAAYVAGFLAGILGGAYNTNGPPIIIYGVLARWPPERLRATLQGYFTVTAVAILTGHALAGLWTPDVLWLFAWSLPLIGLAFVLGTRISRALTPGRFEPLLYGFLVVVGALLLA